MAAEASWRWSCLLDSTSFQLAWLHVASLWHLCRYPPGHPLAWLEEQEAQAPLSEARRRELIEFGFPGALRACPVVLGCSSAPIELPVVLGMPRCAAVTAICPARSATDNTHPPLPHCAPSCR